jgi:signal peptidase II
MTLDSSTSAQARPALLWGPFTRFGLTVAVLAGAIDQAVKLWLLLVLDLGGRGIVTLTRSSTRAHLNTGISYGLFRQEGAGQWALLALKAIAVILLWIWLSRRRRLTALGLGLIISGAIGSAIDRLPMAQSLISRCSVTKRPGFNGTCSTSPSVATIVAGVIGLLYETILGASAAKHDRDHCTLGTRPFAVARG